MQPGAHARHARAQLAGEIGGERGPRSGRERVAAIEERAHGCDLRVTEAGDIPARELRRGTWARGGSYRGAWESRTTSVPAARSPRRWLFLVARIEISPGR